MPQQTREVIFDAPPPQKKNKTKQKKTNLTDPAWILELGSRDSICLRLQAGSGQQH